MGQRKAWIKSACRTWRQLVLNIFFHFLVVVVCLRMFNWYVLRKWRNDENADVYKKVARSRRTQQLLKSIREPDDPRSRSSQEALLLEKVFDFWVKILYANKVLLAVLSYARVKVVVGWHVIEYTIICYGYGEGVADSNPRCYTSVTAARGGVAPQSRTKIRCANDEPHRHT